MENCGFAHFFFAVEARSPYDVVFFPLLDLGLHGNLWFYVSRTHISKKRVKGESIDSGLVFDPIWEYNLLIGGSVFAFLLIWETFCRCRKKWKTKNGYGHH